MSYTVLWKPTAERALAAYWVEADSQLQQAITRTTNELDEQLKRDPFAISESRKGLERIVVEPPLVLAIEVREQDRLVYVLSIRVLPER